ncbi:MAG: hypothetical protein ABIP77_04565 [Candidatus Limnocylindrales bacterium]
MTRGEITAVEKHSRAVVAGRRMVSRGERPGYRLQPLQDGSWGALGLPGVSVASTGRRAARDAMRAAIAEVLDVGAEAFDQEI